ncbi:MAG: hypothetical protein PHV39_05350 [Methanomicrobium sp.]|jgi:hypothetical protein|nr:hypothetical protein [Methanomicrobium sp.]
MKKETSIAIIKTFAQNKPLSTYDIAVMMSKSYGNIHPQIKELSKLGYLIEYKREIGQNGRQKIIYRLSLKGIAVYIIELNKINSKRRFNEYSVPWDEVRSLLKTYEFLCPAIFSKWDELIAIPEKSEVFASEMGGMKEFWPAICFYALDLGSKDFLKELETKQRFNNKLKQLDFSDNLSTVESREEYFKNKYIHHLIFEPEISGKIDIDEKIQDIFVKFTYLLVNYSPIGADIEDYLICQYNGFNQMSKIYETILKYSPKKEV